MVEEFVMLALGVAFALLGLVAVFAVALGAVRR